MQNFIPVGEHDAKLLAHVHPANWQNPKPAGRYNLVVVGAGPAGLVAAAGAAGLGAKVALIERHLMGGDCLNVGCVPSKALLRCARAAAEARGAARFGTNVHDVQVNFGQVMERVRELRAGLSPHDSAERFRTLGVDVFLGEGSFTGPGHLQVAGQALRFSKAVIATGARAVILPIPGLKETGCLTNETVFQLIELPKKLAVIGAGPVGCEMAQAFARLGAEVSLFEAETRILPREDPEAAVLLESSLRRDGISIFTGARIEKVERTGREKRITATVDGVRNEIAIDEILLGVGRAPNIEALNLEAAGVAYTKAGVTVNDYLQTSNRRIYAAGDVCLPQKFTHAADAAARIVLQNALFLGRKKMSAAVIPWCTYTSPEIAHVGVYESHVPRLRTFRHDFAQLDRAVLESDLGFVKLHLSSNSDQILGATVVGAHAGEMISTLAFAMHNNLGLGSFSNALFPYPTLSEAIKKAADVYSRTRLTPGIKRLLEWWLRRTR